MGDECYSHFVYPPHKPFSIASVKDSKANVIIIGSVSKTFAMTGWRIGYTLAPEALVQASNKLQSQSTSNPTSIAQYAALAAMTGPMDAVPPMLAEYEKRRKRIVEGLREIPGVTCEWPGGAFYAFPNVSSFLADSANGPALAASCTELSRQLLDRARVALVPGAAFGAPGYLRLSYATSIERIDEGLRRLKKFFTARGSGCAKHVKPAPSRIEPVFMKRIWGSRSLAPLFPEKINLAEPLGGSVADLRGLSDRQWTVSGQISGCGMA